ncbi:MAG: hypothetical protein ACLQKK_12580 [Rhodomicrobium sp.]
MFRSWPSLICDLDSPNFEDRFIAEGRANVMIKSGHVKSLWGQTIIVIVILAAVVFYAWLYASPQSFMGLFAVCYGFLIGWFAGWLGKRWQGGS